ncbi:MAG: bifunctional ornithine acetyltransferase/N-acetylglutamate synthase [Solirubrobacteraceae bacterium]
MSAEPPGETGTEAGAETEIESPTIFTSRWVPGPDHVTELGPTRLARGFRAAGVAAGLKPKGLDVGVLVCDASDTVSAARFTTNARVGAPVIASREADTNRLRAVVANSGGSNTGDGERGLGTARATQALAAELLGVTPEQVGVASTGVIGTMLPREPLLAGVASAVAQLRPDDADAFSRAIMTSDVSPKRACLEVRLPSGLVRISAQAKGAGMISPRFATMFCFVQTDARLSTETIELLTGVCVKRSFDRISVDGQLSTSDTVFVQASGASGVEVQAESEDEVRLGEALDAVMRALALKIVGDGEGARRTGRIVVRGDADHVERVARAIADSPLVKTALHGGDPNFGRILQAAGMAYPPGAGFVADLHIEGRQVVSAGEAVLEDLRELEPLVRGAEVQYELTIPGSGGETEVFFSDLSPEYVRFNSEYTS